MPDFDLKSPDDINSQVLKRFEAVLEGYLQDKVDQEIQLSIDPKWLTRKTIGQQGVASRVRQWIISVKEMSKKTPDMIEWRIKNFGPDYGSHSLPIRVHLPNLKAAADFLGRGAATSLRRTVCRYDALAEISPEMRATAGRWKAVDELADEDFAVLLALLNEASRGGLAGHTMRSLNLPGMHSKWIERQARLLKPFFEALGCYNPNGETLEKRLGFDTKDGAELLAKIPHENAAAPFHATCFYVRMDIFPATPLRTAIFFENKDVFDRFNPSKGQVFLWGQGYAAVKACREMQALRKMEVFYWGDCDSHGYQILALCRRELPKLRSIYMDETTVRQQIGHAETEPEAARKTVTAGILTDDEAASLCFLQERGKRLEQEHLQGVDPAGLVKGI